MINKNDSIENKLFISKMMDKAKKAQDFHKEVCSDFLDPHQKSLLSKLLSGDHETNYYFNGGYDGAEREMIFFCPNNISEEATNHIKPPIILLEAKLNSRESITHRDCLGALMSLGIKREKIGDIIVKEEFIHMLVSEDIAEFIRYNLNKIGNANIEIVSKELSEIKAPAQKTKEVKATVASMRLDCIASAGFNISRNKITEFIKGDKVSLNWESTDSLTKQIKQGDMISIRGKGRVVVEEVGGTTKKGRVSITMKKFV